MTWFLGQNFLAQPCLAYARLALGQNEGAAPLQAREEGPAKGSEFRRPAYKRKSLMASHATRMPRAGNV